MMVYAKFVAAAAGFLGVVGECLADGKVTTMEYGLMATAAATALAVFGFKNAPKA